MDKYEYKVRADEIKDLIAKKDYVQAAEIADTIDWRRVKSVMMLCTVSDLYKINRRYEDAKNMLLLAYERRPGGRTICYSLCELSIKMEEFVQAVEYYKEFVQVAPKDSGKFVLQYKLYEAQNVGIEERIQVLEELKKYDYREKWAYELAYLYHKVGLATQCVEECDEMILWFVEGKYVIKAMELKMLHQPLTPAQQEIYDNRFHVEEPETVQPEKTETTEADAEINYEVSEQTESETCENAEQKADDMDIHVKTMDVGKYNTINLQAELAEGLKEVLQEENNHKSPDYLQIDQVTAKDLEAENVESENLESESEEILESAKQESLECENEESPEFENEEIESSEIFFGATGEIGDLTQSGYEIEMTEAETPQEENVSQITWDVELPKELADVLSQEADGQIRLVMPEEESIEKQITGQMNIEDILAEWEHRKKEKEKEQTVQTVIEELPEIAKEEPIAKIMEESTKEIPEEITEETIEEVAEEILEDSLEETEDIVWEVEEGVSEEAIEDVEEPPVVEREKAKVRTLTREERELYAPFVQSRSARIQLVQAVDNISLAAYTGNIIITGEEGMDTLTLAKNMIREVQMEDSNFSGKVAKISGNVLNKNNVASIIANLKNGALIILKASQMNSKTANALNKSLQQENTGIIVVLVDTKKAIDHFLAEHAELHGCFTARMDMEALSNDTLVAFGRQYAREMEYSIDEMGVLALHTKITNMQTSDHIVTVVEVKRMVDNAIRNVNKKTIGHFFDVLFAKRYDDEDMIILGEKDFI